MSNLNIDEILASAENGQVSAAKTVPTTAQIGYSLIKSEKVNIFLYNKIEAIINQLSALGIALDETILERFKNIFLPNLVQVEANKERIFAEWTVRREVIGQNKLLVQALHQALANFDVNTTTTQEIYLEDYSDLTPLNARTTINYMSAYNKDPLAWTDQAYVNNLAANFQVMKRQPELLYEFTDDESVQGYGAGDVVAEAVEDDNPLIANPLPTIETTVADAGVVAAEDVKADVLEPETTYQTDLPTFSDSDLALDAEIENPLPTLDLPAPEIDEISPPEIDDVSLPEIDEISPSEPPAPEIDDVDLPSPEPHSKL